MVREFLEDGHTHGPYETALIDIFHNLNPFVSVLIDVFRTLIPYVIKLFDIFSRTQLFCSDTHWTF